MKFVTSEIITVQHFSANLQFCQIILNSNKHESFGHSVQSLSQSISTCEVDGRIKEELGQVIKISVEDVYSFGELGEDRVVVQDVNN